MHFEPDTIYHIYNQGNNRQPIFFKPENYLFFLQKMRKYLLPHGDLLCYCLMPNHFHWLFFVREVSVAKSSSDSPGDSKSPGEYVPQSVVVAESGVDLKSPPDSRMRSLNDSIAILLRSYTRAINLQEDGRSGSLFRKETKAKDGWIEGFISLEDRRTRSQFWNDFGYTCFQYIHENPVKAGLVTRAQDWLYSSCQDYVGLRKGTLCNQSLAKELLNLP